MNFPVYSFAKANNFSVGSFAKANNFPSGSFAKANNFPVGSFAKANKTLLFCVMFVSSAFAQEQCGLSASVLRSGFERGEQPATVTLPPQSTPLALNVIYPLEGAVINVSRIQLYGTFTGPANTGITVNNTLNAATDATNFTFAPLALANGPQVLTITAKTLDGLTQTVVRNITVNSSGIDSVRFVSRARGGFAPFRGQFDLTTTVPPGQTTAVRFEIDFNGDGVFEFDSPSAPTGELSYEYQSAGVYLARARVSFDDGQTPTPLDVRESTFRIQTDTIAFTRQTLCAVYYEMKHRLQAGQFNLAGNTLPPKIRAKYLSYWNAHTGTVPTTAGKLGEIVTGQISDVSADFQVAIPIVGSPGQFRGFPLQFARSLDGVWRISGM
jgi:hypothetical protein